MNPIKLSALFFTGVMLTACGGGGSPTEANNTTGGGDGGTTTTGDGDTTSTSTTVGQPELGSGTGSNFQISVIQVQDGGLEGGRLAAGGQVNLTLDIVDVQNGNARISGTEYGVIFSSGCADANPPLASFESPEQTITQGSVSTAYVAGGCAGEDIIVASLYESTGGSTNTSSVLSRATATIDVVPPIVNDISYVGADNTLLGLSKIGNPALPQVAKLTFKVTDINGDPISNQLVNFALASDNSGASLAASSKTTNSAGEVVAVLNASEKRTTLRVIASTDFEDVDGQSKSTFVSSEPISVSTGFPVQRKMTLTASSFNPLSVVDGGAPTDSTITVYLADEFGNPPPVATVVNFTTEGGMIGARCETNEEGNCEVDWTGTLDIPTLASGSERVGFTTIMAYTQGDADFDDSNNNGVFDIGEPYSAYAEPFRDDNLDGTWQVGEVAPIDIDNNGSHTAASGVSTYQGTLCGEAARAAGHCATNMAIWAQIKLVMSGEADDIRLFRKSDNTEVTSVSLTEKNYYVVVQDINDNIPARGVGVTYAAEYYQVDGEQGNVRNTTGEINIPGLPSFGMVYEFTIQDEDPADNPPVPEFIVQVTPAGLTSVIKRAYPIVP